MKAKVTDRLWTLEDMVDICGRMGSPPECRNFQLPHCQENEFSLITNPSNFSVREATSIDQGKFTAALVAG
jgi:hypothetical protein